MANLLSQNIGTNYKSILNLDATTINTPLDATLRAVTDGMGNASILQLSTEQVGISRTLALSAGATNPRLFNEVYTINNSGAQTGTATGIFLNATETNLNGITHNLMDLQVGGVSRFSVNRTGATTCGATIIKGSGTTSATLSLLVQNSAGVDLLTVQDNGTLRVLTNNTILNGLTSTNSFVTSGTGNFNAFISWDNNSGNAVLRAFNDNGNVSIGIGTTTRDVSACLFLASTTRGFLPPRMTTTQKNAIATPTAGLMVYDTILNKLCIYTTVWEVITSV